MSIWHDYLYRTRTLGEFKVIKANTSFSYNIYFDHLTDDGYGQKEIKLDLEKMTFKYKDDNKPYETFNSNSGSTVDQSSLKASIVKTSILYLTIQFTLERSTPSLLASSA